MKKLLALALVALVLLVISVYVFIPSKIIVSNVRYITAYQNTAIKFINDSAMFNKWWRSVTVKEDTNYNYNGYTYHIKSTLSNLADIGIQPATDNLNSALVCLNIYLDSSALQWSTELDASLNPVQRIMQYNKAKKLKENMGALLDKLKAYLDKPENVYGINVKEVKLKDSVLIASQITTTAYPSVPDIYKEVNKLKAYVVSQQASATNAPMLNVSQLDEKNYKVMVGLPVSGRINQTPDFIIKRMPYGGSMFTSTVNGGYYSIQQALQKLTEYYLDTKRASPAKPYELMVTDRQQETDTAKWVTKLYYPIM